MSEAVIDIHAHYVPNLVFERFAARQSAFPGVSMKSGTSLTGGRSARFQFPGGEPTRPVMSALSELAERTAWMDREGIDHQILSLWTDLEGYELAPEQGLAWSRFINECLMEELAGQRRFTPLATVPLQDGRMAAEVLAEVLQSGFAGVMIGTLPKGVNGGNLDDPDLDPFWEAASRLEAAVYLHPMFLCNEPRLADYDLINTVGRLADTTIAMGRLLYSGHLMKYPGMKLVLSHGGGALPYALGRFQRTQEAAQGRYADPKQGFETLYFDSCVYDAAALAFLIQRATPQRIMMGTDSPMSIGEVHPTALVSSVLPSGPDRAAILGGNARRVFRIRGDCSCVKR